MEGHHEHEQAHPSPMEREHNNAPPPQRLTLPSLPFSRNFPSGPEVVSSWPSVMAPGNSPNMLSFVHNLDSNLQNIQLPRNLHETLPPIHAFLQDDTPRTLVGPGSVLGREHELRSATQSEPAWSQTGQSDLGAIPQHYQESVPDTPSPYSDGYRESYYEPTTAPTTAPNSWSGSQDGRYGERLHRKSIEDYRYPPRSPAFHQHSQEWRRSVSSMGSLESPHQFSPTDTRLPVGNKHTLDEQEKLEVSDDEDGEHEVDKNDARPLDHARGGPSIFITESGSGRRAVHADYPYQHHHPNLPSHQSQPDPKRPHGHARSHSGPGLGEMPPPHSSLRRSQSASHRNRRKQPSKFAEPYQTPSSHRPKKPANAVRIFNCVFRFANCTQTFASKNEWKRHVGSQHMLLHYWRCDLDGCRDRNSVFNRKDLFGQHLKRMHTPSGTREAQSFTVREIPRIQERCKHVIREPPPQSTCGFCGHDFDGPGSWEQRMEHVGRHYEGGGVDPASWRPDHDFIRWAVHERLVFPTGSSFMVAAQGKEAVVSGALQVEGPPMPVMTSVQ